MENFCHVRIRVSVMFLLIILLTFPAYAGSYKAGIHSGYGVMTYEEDTTALGRKDESESTLNTVLLGAYGEYSFSEPKNFFAGITADWAYGLEDTESWKRNGSPYQTNNLEIFGQFYGGMIGYNKSLDRLYYRIYLSGGWDGIHFRRGNIVENGIGSSGYVTEDFSLWSTGGGIGGGYKLGNWALEGKAAYAFYPVASVKNSSYPGFKFETDGTRIDIALGAVRQLTEKINLYLGGSFTSLELNESEVKQTTNKSSQLITIVFPNSRTEIVAGMVNLSYTF